MATVTPELKTKLERNANALVDVIVRVKDDPQTYVQKLESRGLTVRHTYSLISALALRGKASAALALAQESWVVSIEADKSVHTM